MNSIHVDESRLESDLEYRFKYLADFIGFHENEISAIREVGAALTPKLPAIVDRIYERMFTYDAAKRHFLLPQHGYSGRLPSNIDELGLEHEVILFRKRHLQEYFERILTQKFDSVMISFLDLVGRIHVPGAGSAQLLVPLVQINALLGFMVDEFRAALLGLGSNRETEARFAGVQQVLLVAERPVQSTLRTFVLNHRNEDVESMTKLPGASTVMQPFLNRPMPPGLEELSELAFDLRWSWSHGCDRLWEMLDAEAWERTGNPYLILQNVSQARLEAVAKDPAIKRELQKWMECHRHYLADPAWFGSHHSAADLRRVAYFSMEFGLTEALPIYSGGLGVLAGDYLKVASDLGVPLVGVGLLYQQGYFRQVLDPSEWQLEAFPYSDPTSLPVVPVQDLEGGWLRISLKLPGRMLHLRVWQAKVGKVQLYLLDSNDSLNDPWDRGITATLYGGGQERRLLQEIALGIGGWFALDAMGLDVEICHLNEGHAALAILARAGSFMLKSGQSFDIALWATRAGNIFTTHTPVAAAFDRFDPQLIDHYSRLVLERLGLTSERVLGLGRLNPLDPHEPFNMAYLAMRGCGYANGVSRLHGRVSRHIFQELFPEWPHFEVPIQSVTNGVHVPTWDSQSADALWTRIGGDARWLGTMGHLEEAMSRVGDDELWDLRAASRKALVSYIRQRLVRQKEAHCATPDALKRFARVLDPNVLTLGFARRFTSYKRPNLILTDPDRLARLLNNSHGPVQLIVAGKSHPADVEGKRLVQSLARFADRPDVCDRVVFLEDYDLTLSQHLVAGVDVWLNTPCRPWEASGTSGMKVLVNGGLNLSELDGWWAEAYTPDVGWALGDGREHREPGWDQQESTQLYDLLEHQVVPEFYDRDPNGVPVAWIKRVRASMSRLTPQYSNNRMQREYVTQAYLPAAAAYRRRTVGNGRAAVELNRWQAEVAAGWKDVRFGEVRTTQKDGTWQFQVQVYLGDLDAAHVRVQLYANPLQDGEPFRAEMLRDGAIHGAINSHLYLADAPASRPANHYTPRIIPFHPEALVPLEETRIRWHGK